ncbi:MAG: electron transfer flavoprotein subunit beta/FixA family protein [Acidobacteria bacterium]|nr:electron transfer flavoprotein subunit beta/FixA family protein [Acidobacteriota bacterium]
MNIYVCIKQVPDTEATLLVKDGVTINENDIKWIMSPYDEYALEEALKLKEKLPGSTVTVMTLGPSRVESTLRTGLAMGAENAVHIETTELFPDHKTVAAALGNAIKQDPAYGIIFLGKQAIDDDSYLTHIYLAEHLGIPVATNVIAFKHDNDKVVVEREIDEGAREKIEMPVPCVVGATKGLNTPRYASLMGIMKAKKIPIKKLSLQDAGISQAINKIKREKLFAPAEKPQGRIIPGEVEDSVKELVKVLKEEAKVL